MSTKRFMVRTAAITLMLAAGAAFSQAQRAPDPAAAAEAPALDGPVVKLAQGKAQGYLSDGVAIFKGLPFAAPPVGDLRWRPPKAAAKWPDVRAANVFSSTCAKAEDCLYLNIWTPEWPAKQPRAVMFWIHGGSNRIGSGNASQIMGSLDANGRIILINGNGILLGKG